MSKINQPPFGLQSLFGSKNFGDNPSELSQVVGTGVDLLPFIAAERIDYRRATVLTQARGDTVDIKVPLGELWMLLNANFSLPGATSIGTKWAGTIELFEQPKSAFPVSPFVLEYGPEFTVATIGDGSGFAYEPGELNLIWSDTIIRGRLIVLVPGAALDEAFELNLQFYRFEV